MDRSKVISILKEIGTLIDEATDELGVTESVREKRSSPRSKRPLQISFNDNVLAVMKKHGRGLSSKQKFTLLLARLAKGNLSQRVSSGELQKNWNKMKAVLGGKYNAAHANRAKAEGWVDTPKHGVYTLSAVWKEALTEDNE